MQALAHLHAKQRTVSDVFFNEPLILIQHYITPLDGRVYRQLAVITTHTHFPTVIPAKAGIQPVIMKGR
jgi:hypothetical protein